MAFDFKKEYKEFYMPKQAEIVTVPKQITLRLEERCQQAGGHQQQSVYYMRLRTL